MTHPLAQHKIDGAIETLLRWAAFSTPLYIVGIEIAGYPVTLPLVLVVLLDIALVFRGTVRPASFAVISVLLGWFLLTAVGRYPPGSYILSLSVLGLILFPFAASLPGNVRPKRILRWFIYGAISTSIFVGWEIGMNVVGLPALEDLFPYGTFGTARSGTYLGFQRINATYVEPAGYATYLVFLYALLDLSEYKGIPLKRRGLMKVITAGMVVLLLSLSGIILLLGYLGCSFLLHRRRKILDVVSSGTFWARSFATGVLFSGLLAVYWPTVQEVYNLFAGRIEQIFIVIDRGIFSGSEGGRVQSALVVFRYWGEQGFWEALYGEGYAHHEQWLMREYWYLPPMSSFRRGDLHNIFSAVGIATGIVGYLLYLSFLTTLARGYQLPLGFVGLLVLAHGATGFLIDVQFWLPVLIGTIVLGNRGEPKKNKAAEF